MFLQRSRGVFLLRLFWRSGLRPSRFLRKQGFWKSAVHLLNHPVRSRAGAVGPKWGSTLSRAQHPIWAWPGHGGWTGQRAESLERWSPPPPAHAICFSAVGLWPGTAGEERAAFLSQSAKGIPPGAPLAADSQGGAGAGRQCGSPGGPGSLWTGVSLTVCLRPPALSLCSCVYQCGLHVEAAAFLVGAGFLGGKACTYVFASYVCVHICAALCMCVSLRESVGLCVFA